MARWQDYVLRGTRAAQPNDTSTTIGTLYCVTDENNKLERWSGTAWENYSVTVAGFGDVFGPSASVDSEITLFSGVTGKLIKRATGTGVVHATSGVYSVGAVNLTSEVSNTLPVTNGGLGFNTCAQGDIIYGSAADTLANLAKDTNATRYLSNTGASNNPAWAQVDLSNGVTGRLPYANLTAAVAASTLLGRRSTGSGDWEPITLGTNLSMSGTTLNAAGSGSSVVNNAVNCFRLTLATGQPVFVAAPATPSSTDTVNDIVTFTDDPGWYNGTIVTPASTLAGLTAGTTYYMHRITSTTYSFHTTVAAAMSGASRVNLTASVTQLLYASGISTTGIYFTPYTGNVIALYTGYAWVQVTLSELSVGLGTLTANTNYDLFVDYNGGSPTLSIGTAWSSDTARAVALVRQDGVWVSSADSQSRYVGTFRTDSTTTVIDNAGYIISQVGGKRFLWNWNNRVPQKIGVQDGTTSWLYNSTTIRQANAAGGGAGNQVEVVVGLWEAMLDIVAQASTTAATTAYGSNSIGQDSTTATDPDCGGNIPAYNAVNTMNGSMLSPLRKTVPLGYHKYCWLESCSANVNVTFYGSNIAATGPQYKGGILGTIES